MPPNMKPIALAASAAACVAWLATARAEEASRRVGGYELRSDGAQLEVWKGKRHATLSADARVVRMTGDAQRVDVELATPCTRWSTRYTLDQLEARLVNSDALVLHRARSWARAAVGFTRAVQLDPTWRLPAYNLASADVQLGDSAAALATLAPWLASEPVVTYVQVWRDPELRPLLTSKPLAAVRAAAPGSARVGDGALDFAYSAAHGLVAYTVDHSGWSSCYQRSDVELHDIRTGKLVATIAAIADSDNAGATEDCPAGFRTRRAALVAERAVAINRLLADLGFVTTSAERTTLTTGSGKPAWHFPRAQLGVVVGADNHAHILRGDRTVGTSEQWGQDAVYLDVPKVMVFFATGHDAGACSFAQGAMAPVAP